MKKYISNLIRPKSKNEDIRRREYILNVILLGSIFLALAAVLRISVDLVAYGKSSIPLTGILIILFIFLFLLYLSRKGFIKTASSILVAIFFLPNLFIVYNYGLDLPQGMLTFALLIVIASILVDTKFGYLLTFTIAIINLILLYFQKTGVYSPNSYWRFSGTNISDVIVATITLVIIMIVSWLSNREIERSLDRARKSEKALKKERDLLEVRVQERTRELREAEIEKINQLSRFAEFGKISSGIFHDLLNPLTAISLNLEEIKNLDSKKLKNFKVYIDDAVEANEKMQSYVTSVKKQIQQQDISERFSLNKEIEDSINVLNYKAIKNKVKLIFKAEKIVYLKGNPLKFHQIVSNLISNAIDAYYKTTYCMEVTITLKEEGKNIYLTVEDYGKGLNEKDINKIFDPFYTTKDTSKGMGIGLSITKETVEKDFRGEIAVESKKGKGTKFTIKLPLKTKTTETKNARTR